VHLYFLSSIIYNSLFILVLCTFQSQVFVSCIQEFTAMHKVLGKNSGLPGSSYDVSVHGVSMNDVGVSGITP